MNGASPTPAEPTPLDHGFSNGDILTWLVPTSPGGGFDTQSRLLAPYFEAELRRITGTNIRVVVENQPGAQQRTGIETLYRQRADGLSIAYFSGRIVGGHQAFRGTNYDLTKMTAIGSLPHSPLGIAVRKDSGVEPTLRAWATRSETQPVLVIHSGVDPDIRLMAEQLKSIGWTLNLDYVAIDGTSPTVAALLRGDGEWAVTTAPSMRRIVDDSPNELQMMINLGCEPSEGDPGTPTLQEQNVPNWKDICEAQSAGSRVIYGPPGIPEGTTEALRQAFLAAGSNPEHIAAARKAGFDSRPINAEDTEASIDLMFRLYEQYKDIINITN